MAQYKVAIDAGHGGSDPGAVYNGRQEKDDVLRLAMAVGRILENNGVDVFYVRENDEYETPFKKATDANNENADLFISIHRNSSERENQYSGIETLVFNDDGIKARLARNINSELEKTGYKNLGVDERPNLVVLRRTRMPAALVEVGFINNEEDNRLFDNNFNAIAKGIADGILDTLYDNNYSGSSYPDIRNSNRNPNNNPNNNLNNNPNNSQNSNRNQNTNQNTNMNNSRVYSDIDENTSINNGINNQTNNGMNNIERLYRVQVGAYRNRESADRLLNSLLIEGYPAFIILDNGIYKVQVGAYQFLANAIKMEERLRKSRYNTYITT